METNKRKALGKGLEQLFSNESLYVEPTVYTEPTKKLEEIVENTPKEDIVEVNVSELRSNPYQPRQVFDQEKLVELLENKDRLIYEKQELEKQILDISCKKGFIRKKIMQFKNLLAQFSQK